MTKFHVVMLLAMMPVTAFAQTPKLDAQQAFIEKYFRSEGISNHAISEIYLAAWAQTKNEVCGEDNFSRVAADNIAKVHEDFAKAFGLPPIQFRARAELMMLKFKSTLISTPTEAEIFCKATK